MGSSSLDQIDHELLAALQNNARLSNKELAARVGLAPSSCLERVRRLTRDGVVRGFHADVAPEALGVAIEALVFVGAARQQGEIMDALWHHVAAMPEVCDLYYVAGSHDLVIHVAVRDVEHLRALVAERISNHCELGRIETSLIFRHQRAAALPNYAQAEAPAARGR